MIAAVRKRVTYSNVIATMALFIALGGVAVAATQLPRNSVGKRQLKRGAVTSAKLAKKSVIAGKLGPNSVSGAEVAPNGLAVESTRATLSQDSAVDCMTSARRTSSILAFASLAGEVRRAS